MGGRGASSSSRGSGGGYTKALAKSMKDIDEKKAGATYRNLSESLKRSINVNLMPSKEFRDGVSNGVSLSDEWRTSVKGFGARKVITEAKNGKIEYTVKNRNKILLKTNDKNRVANQIAQFYSGAERQIKKSKR